MPSTKIINVLRNDTFEDVFNSFLDTQAKEVIFIMPRGSRLIRNSQYFETIKDEADNSGKLISIMTSDPIISEYAERFGITLLSQESKKKSSLVNTEQSEQDNQEDELMDTPIRIDSSFSHSSLTSASIDEEDRLFDIEKDETEDEIIDEESDDDATGDIELASIEDSVQSPYSDRPIVSLAFAKSKTSKKPARHKATTKTSKSSDETILEKNQEQSQKDEIVQSPTPAILAPVTEKLEQVVQPINPFAIDQSYTIDKAILQNDNTDKSPVYDIKPRSSNDVAKNLSNLWLEKSDSSNNVSLSSKPSNPTKKPMPKLIFIGVALFTLVAILIGYTYMGTAEIIVKPQTQPIDLELTVTVSTSEDAEKSQDSISGKLFTENAEVSESQDASSQREAAAKSSGTITIYNTNPQAQKLIATTRFESPEGKIFRIDKSVEIPSGSKNNPGTIKAKVFADKAGQDYNIEPARFTVPGLKDSSRYTEIYAVSESPFTGGGVGLSKIVTEGDISIASSKSLNKLTSNLKDAINSKAEDLKIIGYNDINIESRSTSVDAEQVADSVVAVTKGSLSTIGFVEQDLMDLILSKLNKDSNTYAIKEGSMEIAYDDIAFNIADNKMSFKVKASGTAYSIIDRAKTIDDIAGMPENAIQTYFKSKKEVETVQIIFSPFWLRSIPSDKSKINLTVDI